MSDAVFQLENIMNSCLDAMKENIIKYQLSVENQRQLVGQAVSKINILELNSELAINVLADYIYSKTNYNSVDLKELVNYANNRLPHNKEGFTVYNVLKNLLLQKQLYYLNKAVLATYQNNGYLVATKAIKDLKDTGKYHTFSSRNYQTDNKTTNYRQDLANIITASEVDGVVKYGLRNQKMMDNIYEQFVNSVTIDKQSQCLSIVVEATMYSKTNTETVDALKKFIEDNNDNTNFLGFIEKQPYSKINYRGIMHKYVNPRLVPILIKRYLVNMKINISGLSNDEIINQYVNIKNQEKMVSNQRISY